MKSYTKKSVRRRGFIYFRYIFPILSALMSAGLLFVPAYRYITAETGMNSPISIGEYMGNSWETVRQYLFGGGDAEKSVATQYFAKYLFAVLIVFALLFAVGFAFRIYAALNGFLYFKDGCRDSRRRALFLTLVPNRTVACIWHALSLPIFTFGMLTPIMYNELLNIPVRLTYVGFDMLWAAVALFAAEVAVIFVSARFERLEKMDVFTRRRAVEPSREISESVERVENDEDKYSKLERRARQEQADRIRELLDKHSGDKN